MGAPQLRAASGASFSSSVATKGETLSGMTLTCWSSMGGGKPEALLQNSEQGCGRTLWA